MNNCWGVVDKNGNIKFGSESHFPAAAVSEDERYCFTAKFDCLPETTKLDSGITLVDEGNGHASIEKALGPILYYAEVKAVGNTIEDVSGVLSKAKELIFG